MIISRTPFRVPLFGGWTDFPQWYRHHGGAVIGGSINKYCYISLRELPPFFEHKHRIVYSNIEQVHNISEIKHPSVRACLGEMGIETGLEIHHDGDLPARSGLGSSSSFTVGLLNALHAYRGRMASKQELAEEAIRIEQQVIGENVGSQDQVWAAYGGINRIDFLTDGRIEVSPLLVSAERRSMLERNLVLYFTGFTRIASEIEKDKLRNLSSRETHLRTLYAMADEATEILRTEHRSLDEIGRLLHESWMIKRDLSSSVSNKRIDDLYDTALSAGALGGKLLGAGGGGFLLLYVPFAFQTRVHECLKDLISVGFRFDGGSKIVIYEPQLNRTGG
ncbi:GHMP family kinase ATP-binding protein [Azospirillum agricola]|uniref:GHMP family kinase ATP-binding protein n=1 Tax=Azospirillum agricola TaxID=1720247 RepID=UPI000A0F232D|nr:kinase [Azospirillum agricola]SMH41707.1 D-glycero-alpha-D-manno-heptose-7-phosphate kinase [Azospirillum lipoferum]